MASGPSTEREDSGGALAFTALMTLSMVIWGGSWVSAKAIADAMAPEALTFWRFLLSFVSMIPIVAARREPLRLTAAAWAYTAIGSAAFALYMYLFFLGLSVGNAGSAGVLVTTTMPLVTLVLSVLLLGKRATARDLGGLLLGVAGGFILLKAWSLDPSRIFTGGNAYFLGCAALWSILTISSQKAGATASPLVFSLFVYAFSTIAFYFASPAGSLGAAWGGGLLLWGNLFYLSVISSTFATTVYFFASARLSSYRASSFAFLVPSSAVVLSWLILGETPTAATIAGGTAAIAATYIINLR